MERITTLLDKIRELNATPNAEIIDIDLMIDYTRVIYADLLEWRNKVAFNNAVARPALAETTPTSIFQAQPDRDNGSPVPPAAERQISSQSAQPQAASLSFPESQYIAADIRQRIGINDKYLFISELFGNNKDAYDEVISEINTFHAEEEAIAWISRNIASQFNWQDDSEAVQSFYKLLSDHFDV